MDAQGSRLMAHAQGAKGRRPGPGSQGAAQVQLARSHELCAISHETEAIILTNWDDRLKRWDYHFNHPQH